MLKMPKGRLIGEGVGEYAYESQMGTHLRKWVYEDPVTVEHGLWQSMEEEGVAADFYQARAHHARVNGDEDAAKLYEHIAAEEGNHRNEFHKQLMKYMEDLTVME